MAGSKRCGRCPCPPRSRSWALDGGTDYGIAARRLGINPGLAHLIATGMPADGGDVYTEGENRRPGVLPGSSQHLANPQLDKPECGAIVQGWLRRRERPRRRHRSST